MPPTNPYSESEAETIPVDESLIDAMLALSPEERVRHNDRMLRTILRLRQGLVEKAGTDGRTTAPHPSGGPATEGMCDSQLLKETP